jgi:hypothetical protein
MSSFSNFFPVFRIWVCLLHVQIVSRCHNMRMFYGMECNITAFISACMILSSLRKCGQMSMFMLCDVNVGFLFAFFKKKFLKEQHLIPWHTLFLKH